MVLIIITFLISVAAALPAPNLVGPAPVNFIDEKDSTASNMAKRTLGGVRISDGKNFTGHPWYGVYAINDCIALNDYAHNILSFRPDAGTECLLMQESCNADTEYVTLYSNSTSCGDLSVYEWIAGADSYFCMTELRPPRKG